MSIGAYGILQERLIYSCACHYNLNLFLFFCDTLLVIDQRCENMESQLTYTKNKAKYVCKFWVCFECCKIYLCSESMLIVSLWVFEMPWDHGCDFHIKRYAAAELNHSPRDRGRLSELQEKMSCPRHEVRDPPVSIAEAISRHSMYNDISWSKEEALSWGIDCVYQVITL